MVWRYTGRTFKAAAMKINIISTNNGVGLTQDANILKTLFEHYGATVTILEFWGLKRQLPPKADVNIMLELFDKRLCTAKRNYLIPNQEWFMPRWFADLPALDAVLCKTHHAVEIFSKHIKCHYISFTSREIPMHPGLVRKFVHLRGRSTTKGTIQLLQAYRDHKGLPDLLIHMTRPFSDDEKKQINEQGLKHLPNITYSTQRLPEVEYDNLISKSTFHICPSPTEGFGHYINEPQGAGCVVLTTNAPPMNELVNADNGILFDYTTVTPHHGGYMYKPDPPQIAAAIDYAAGLDLKKITKLCRNARQAYLFRTRFFEKAITKIVL